MSLLYYIMRDNLISSYLVVRSALVIPFTPKFGNNGIELTHVSKGLMSCFGSVLHYLKSEHYENQIIMLPNNQPGT